MSDTHVANSGRSGKPSVTCGMQDDVADNPGTMPLNLRPVAPMPFDASTDLKLTPAAAINSVRDFEVFLRQSGFSRSDAKRIAARGWNSAENETSALVDLLRANLERLQNV